MFDHKRFLKYLHKIKPKKCQFFMFKISSNLFNLSWHRKKSHFDEKFFLKNLGPK